MWGRCRAAVALVQNICLRLHEQDLLQTWGNKKPDQTIQSAVCLPESSQVRKDGALFL